jgi:FlaA1/EpsC-like NDP-sugar epimerase
LDYNKLLNRKPIITDLKLIKDFIKGKRILVTGGAGSIGSEIVRQLVNFNASSVTVFDNAEASMFHLEQEISRSNPKSHVKYVIGDVRDK